ncbi:hypothetical protein niasHS_009835 [Heterodera schachtii]|uniref:Uncharacterized protein n=1 Tax=Heterodera schachtii TaxID=97005 RepID=A0ABD2JAN0_HETSC
MTTRPSAAIDDNESYLDEQGLRWQRLFAVPDNDLSTLLRICIEFGGGTAQNWSNGNKCIVFGCAFAQQKNADALCPFRLIYVPERRTIYGQIEHKHAHLFAEAINNTINDRKAKEERKEEQQRKIREKEVEYEQKQSEGEKEAEEEVIGDGQGEMGEQREEGREKAIREDQPNGGEKEAKEEVMGDGQRKMGEQREEGREKVVENGYQPNGGEKEAKEEVIGDGQQQSGDEAEKQRELRKIAAEKGTITANEQRQLISNQIVIENAIASSSNAAHSFTDHLDKSWHWLANVREECELKQLCTQKCLKFPVDLEWDKLFFASSSDAIVRLRCNFWQRHRKMCGGSGPSAVVHPPCNYYAIFVPSSGAVLHKFPHNHPQEKENTQKLGVDCFVAKHSDQQHVDFDRMLNWWLPDGWLVLAHLHNLSDLVGLCLRHTLRHVQPNDHHHLRFWHALQSSSSTQMDKNFGSDYVAHLECIFNNVENSSASQVQQKAASLRCPFRALFSRIRQTVYCSAVGHNHPLLCYEGAAQQYAFRKRNDFAPQPPIKLERSEFDEENEISPFNRQQQLAPASVARPCHNKSLGEGHALADARALECAGMSHKRMEVSVSVGAFKRMMKKAEKNMKVRRTQNNLSNESIKVATKNM